MKRTAVVFAGLMISMSTAAALQIAPQCKRMPDQIGCTCAVQNGGGIIAQRGGGRYWYSKRWGNSPTNEAFVNCQMRARGLR